MFPLIMASSFDLTLQKIFEIMPEVILILGSFAVMLVGVSKEEKSRKASFGMALAVVVFSFIYAVLQLFTAMASAESVITLGMLARVSIPFVGFFLLLVAAELPAKVEAHAIQEEGRATAGNSISGEFFGLSLLSLAGAMLCAGAEDLIWLFLALEMTSLPTYILVSTLKDKNAGPEAGVKYFFLGAFSAAIFLYGFAMLYGATGTTNLALIQDAFLNSDVGVSKIAMLGLVMSLIGISFKIAAVPMHFYTADVYQGAATPITAFLAFVPKAAGVFALISVLNLLSWPLVVDTDLGLAVQPSRIEAGYLISGLLWIMAAATMIVGNTLALRQKNLKRILAYSSIAHSGYILVGLYAGVQGGTGLGNGIAAAVFYVITYGLMNTGAFAVIAMLEKRGEEVDSLNDIKGLCKRDPRLGWLLVICVFSLAGIPPFVGFLGKLYLFGALISVGSMPAYVLAVIGVLNSAIAAVYYLWIISAAAFEKPEKETVFGPYPIRYFGAVVVGFFVLAFAVMANSVIGVAREATSFTTLREIQTLKISPEDAVESTNEAVETDSGAKLETEDQPRPAPASTPAS